MKNMIRMAVVDRPLPRTRKNLIVTNFRTDTGNRLCATMARCDVTPRMFIRGNWLSHVCGSHDSGADFHS